MKWIFILFILLGSINVFPQIRISGKITDIKSNPIQGANVSIKDTYDGNTSGSDGKYSFSTSEEGEKILVASFIGYQTKEEKIILSGKNLNINFILEETTSQLNQVVISAGSFEASDEKKGVILRPLDIVTTAGANADIYSVLNTLPGTQKIGETEGLFVRGGTAGESKTIIDEMVVQNPFYTNVPDVPGRGRFSPFLFKGTIFSTGGYSAKYGQALSSVLILKTEDLAPDTRSSIGVMAAGLGGSHSQRWDNSSLSLELNYFNLSPYFKVQKQRTDWENAPEGGDGSLIYRNKLSKNGMFKLYSNYNFGTLSLFTPDLNNLNNKYRFGNKNNYYYLNTSYNNILADDWTLFTGASYSQNIDYYDLGTDKVKRTDELKQIKVTVTKNLFGSSFLTFGGEFQNSIYHDTYNGLFRKLDDNLTAGFVESDIFLSNDIAARIGVRYENAKYINKNNIASRVSLAYKLGQFDQFNFAYGEFYETPGKDYLFQSANLGFERATHYLFNYQYISDQITFRIEGYYKQYHNLVKGNDFSYPGNLFPPNIPYNSGKGYAKGVDLFWRDNQTFKFVDYWISYSYLNTKRDYSFYPTLAMPTYAAPHTLSLVFKHYISALQTSMGATYTYASGRPYYNPNNPEFLGDRAKPYNNLSLSFSYLTNILGNFTVIFFSVDNVLSYENVFGYRFSDNGSVKAPILAPALTTAFIGVFISIGENSTGF
jgi:CarboxypepD_reg-like domain/TonB dependent receptor